MRALPVRVFDGLDETAPEIVEDTLLPCQLAAEAERAPEERLWLAVLLTAMRAIVFVGRHPRRTAVHEVAWIASEAEHPQSFRWVCEALTIEPSVVRRWLAHPPGLRNDLLQRRVHGERPRPQEVRA